LWTWDFQLLLGQNFVDQSHSFAAHELLEVVSSLVGFFCPVETLDICIWGWQRFLLESFLVHDVFLWKLALEQANALPPVWVALVGFHGELTSSVESYHFSSSYTVVAFSFAHLFTQQLERLRCWFCHVN
jgi:hypothetical protein